MTHEIFGDKHIRVSGNSGSIWVHFGRPHSTDNSMVIVSMLGLS